MAVRDRVDLWFTRDGDFKVDSNGDLLDTSGIKNRSLLQEIRTRLSSRKNTWKLTKGIGANLTSFLGEARTNQQISIIRNAIIECLTFDNLVGVPDLEVISMPLNRETVLYRIIVKTTEGELTEDFAYSSDEARFIR